MINGVNGNLRRGSGAAGAGDSAQDEHQRVEDQILRVENLSVRFGQIEPVKGISFSLRRGERVGLVGESGSGKSLTALSIMRLAHGAHLGGSVWLGDEDLLRLSQRELNRVRGGRIAMVYQDPMSSLNPVHTVGRQLIESIRLHEAIDKRAARERAVQLLDDVGVPLPQQRVDQYPHEFSGGMRQRVMIAMALAARPEVLIADEPTTALDVTTQARIVDLLDDIAVQHNTAVMLITHDLGVAAGFCDKVHVMRHGEIVESAPAVDLYARPQHDYTAALLGAVVDLKIDVTKPIPSEIVHTPRVREPVPERAAAQPLLQVESISKTFSVGGGKTITAVDEVSLDIHRGQSYGLVGESGSGKSTVSRCVMALTPIDGGRLFFDGHELHELGAKDLRHLRRRMQMVFQDPLSALNRRRSIIEILVAPLAAHGIGDKRSRVQKALEAMDMVGLPREFADRLPHTMSGGQCQRAAIARSLVLEPELLILDESVSALDVTIQAQVLNLLRDLQRALGLSYLFISHDLAVVRYMCDHISVMRRGQILERGTREELFDDPQHEYTRSLMAAVPIADPRAERARRREATRMVAALHDAEAAS